MSNLEYRKNEESNYLVTYRTTRGCSTIYPTIIITKCKNVVEASNKFDEWLESKHYDKVNKIVEIKRLTNASDIY